ncbi:uncharacterized protein LOC131233107 [Magnolia sinica]|uniref:uncharacterized protein LOC131233107 n=1 Tax=Magnolia sinica TaxID=86752 RepID=UPI00265A3D13|nr:uncharacterized protein LOC131233107 [Magnolia sinica]
MVGCLTRPDLSISSSTEIEKAWHLLSILLRLGRPARPAELAARCELFCVSSDLVEFLCSIPDSPLFLTGDLFVTASMEAFSVFSEFVTRAFTSFVPRIRVRVLGSMRLWDDSVRTYFRKRKGLKVDSALLPTAKRRLLSNSGNDEDCPNVFSLANKIRTTSSKVYSNVGDDMSRGMGFLSVDTSVMEYSLRTFKQAIKVPPLLLDSNAVLSSCQLENIEYMKGEKETEMKCNNMMGLIVHRALPESVHLTNFQHNIFNIEIELNNQNAMTEPDVERDPIRSMQKPVLCNEMHRDEDCSQMNDRVEIQNKMLSTAAICLEENQYIDSPARAKVHDSHNRHAARSGVEEHAGTSGRAHCGKGQDLLDASTSRGDPENFIPLDSTVQMGKLLKNDVTVLNRMDCNDMVTTSLREKIAAKARFPAGVDTALPESLTASKLTRKSIDKQKTLHMDALGVGSRVLLEDDNKVINSPKQLDQYKRDEKFIIKKHKSKRNRNHNTPTKEKRVDFTCKDPKNHLEQKSLPNFESFIIEEEEGSGGYGTVYRAKRKNDGKIFAVKCPHANAHTHHVNNEMKMLERFGGRNFVIKYEGSFTSGNSECFVLEHVEHDRPEVLKREIDIPELQWYGYCMFKALASLHKHGIVHRDVKPGNFLFSRKLGKGYLIDFNLAMDLNQKYCACSKSKTNCIGSLDHIPRPSIKDAPCSNEATKSMHGRFLESVGKGASKDSKSPLETKNIKKNHLKAFPEGGSRNLYRSQGADCSGVNSAKDATSTRTPSVERLREPVPCQGRKELINLVQEALQSPNHEAVTLPVSQRKRVAAPPGKVDRKLVYLSPMPLHSSGITVAGAGLLKKKGEGKHKREGPCVGTKGFRAPEVLFKSPYQSPKVDIWSAGVTLLYLMMGRTPFVGDPEQNIKDIAKLRGSEDLWEVAKLHNRENSFPPDLFDIQSLPAMELREWCELNTRRPDFHELNVRRPDFHELLDLVNKCLTVNPRLRISAEEALRHKFFTNCHDALRKQRLLRRALSSESGSQSL